MPPPLFTFHLKFSRIEVSNNNWLSLIFQTFSLFEAVKPSFDHLVSHILLFVLSLMKTPWRSKGQRGTLMFQWPRFESSLRTNEWHEDEVVSSLTNGFTTNQTDAGWKWMNHRLEFFITSDLWDYHFSPQILDESIQSLWCEARIKIFYLQG